MEIVNLQDFSKTEFKFLKNIITEVNDKGCDHITLLYDDIMKDINWDSTHYSFKCFCKTLEEFLTKIASILYEDEKEKGVIEIIPLFSDIIQDNNIGILEIQVNPYCQSKMQIIEAISFG